MHMCPGVPYGRQCRKQRRYAAVERALAGVVQYRYELAGSRVVKRSLPVHGVAVPGS